VPKVDDSFSFGSTGGPDPPRNASGPPRGAGIVAAARERPAFLALAALAVVLLGVAMVNALGGSSGASVAPIAGSQELRVPAIGDAAPAYLADGRPVFVVHHEDGTVSVVDAFSTHTPFGVGTLVAWCDASRTFDDLRHGSTFDEQGGYILGPAPTGLVTFETTELGTTPATVRVGARRLPEPRTDVGSPLSGSPCTSAADTLSHRIGTEQITDPPSAALGGVPARWIAVAGVLVVTPDGGAQLCSTSDGTAEPSCGSGAPVSGVDGAGLLRGGSSYVSDVSTWLVRTDGTTLSDLTLVIGGQAP
jgi:hypothetical protein